MGFFSIPGLTASLSSLVTSSFYQLLLCLLFSFYFSRLTRPFYCCNSQFLFHQFTLENCFLLFSLVSSPSPSPSSSYERKWLYLQMTWNIFQFVAMGWKTAHFICHIGWSGYTAAALYFLLHSVVFFFSIFIHAFALCVCECAMVSSEVLWFQWIFCRFIGFILFCS